MVTIYSLDDFAQGRIPKPGKGKAALEMFEREAVTPHLGDAVVGAFPYGSVLGPDFTLASDIDYLMLIRDERHKRRVQASIALVRESFHIEMNVDAMTLREARRGEHTIDAGFREHLERVVSAHGHVRGEDPFSHISHTPIPLGLALDMSMRVYLERMRTDYLDARKSEERRARLVKTCVEKPHHVVRIALQWVHGSIAPAGEGTHVDLKPRLLARYEELGPPEGVLDRLALIRTRTREYVSLLEERSCSPACAPGLKKEYARALGRLEKLYGPARAFIRGNYSWLKGLKAAA